MQAAYICIIHFKIVLKFPSGLIHVFYEKISVTSITIYKGDSLCPHFIIPTLPFIIQLFIKFLKINGYFYKFL